MKEQEKSAFVDTFHIFTELRPSQIYIYKKRNESRTKLPRDGKFTFSNFNLTSLFRFLQSTNGNHSINSLNISKASENSVGREIERKSIAISYLT